MTASNCAQGDFTAEDQILELTEDQLKLVEGGGLPMPPMLRLPNGIYNFYPKSQADRRAWY